MLNFIILGSTAVRGLSAGLDPISLEEVNCDGSESSIQDCPTSLIGELSPTCLEPNRAAGVTCSVPEGDCVDPIGVRLVDGPNFFEGRYELCRNNSWLSVCDIGVDQLALTACEARGHFGGIYNNSITVTVIDDYDMHCLQMMSLLCLAVAMARVVDLSLLCVQGVPFLT